MNRPLMVNSFPQSENASAMHSVYSRLNDWRFPNVRKYFADTGYEHYGLVEKITEIVIACNSASADYSNTDEVRGIVPFGVSSVLKSKGPKKS